MDRRAIACDVNDVAACLTRGKTAAPPLAAVRRRITILEQGFREARWKRAACACPEFFQHAFAEGPLRQLLYLRDNLDWKRRATDAMVASLALGSLHGEMDKSNSYFSNQMPRTISTKPAYSVRFWRERGLRPPDRDVFRLLRERAEFRYATPPPRGIAVVEHRDMRELPWIMERLPQPIRCVITSPPYFDVTSFEEDQWLRLWFLGGPPYPTRGVVSRDDRYGFENKYWSFIADMWRSLGRLLCQGGNVVIRIGSGRIDPDRLVRTLSACSRTSGCRVSLVSSEVSTIRNRQTDAFRPGSKGCSVEVDCRFRLASR
jgi:hypothetical protein